MAHNPYNLVDYPGHARPQAQPRRMQTLARLFGLDAPAIESCRVLELGCGDGMHLISIASEFEAARCVGVDLAESGIVKGRHMAQELGLRNVDFHASDIMTIGPEFGEFDYIVAHGVYSWVPAPVRERLLAVCRAHLAPNGVAYVSYNALPGGHLRRMVGEMLRFHTRHVEQPQEKVAAARQFAQSLLAWRSDDSPFTAVLRQEAARMARLADHSLYHDDLADCNEPVHFTDFLAHATHHGLRYLSEAHFPDTQDAGIPSAVVEEVGRMAADRAEREQYLDFIRCRAFRQTLLCRAEVPLLAEAAEQAVEKLHVAANLRCVAADEGRIHGPEAVEFRTEKDAAVTLDRPLLKLALVQLIKAWPRALPFARWLEATLAALPNGAVSAEEDGCSLRRLAFQGYAAGVLELHATPLRATALPGDRPATTRLVRFEAARGTQVTSLRGQAIVVPDPFSRLALQLMDGTRDRSGLTDALLRAVREGWAELPAELLGASDLRAEMRRQLDRNLEMLARMGLLIG